MHTSHNVHCTLHNVHNVHNVHCTLHMPKQCNDAAHFPASSIQKRVSFVLDYSAAVQLFTFVKGLERGMSPGVRDEEIFCSHLSKGLNLF